MADGSILSSVNAADTSWSSGIFSAVTGAVTTLGNTALSAVLAPKPKPGSTPGVSAPAPAAAPVAAAAPAPPKPEPSFIDKYGELMLLAVVVLAAAKFALK